MKSFENFWMAVLICFAVSDFSDGKEFNERQYVREDLMPVSQADYRNSENGGSFNTNMFARPVSYIYYSPNIKEASDTLFEISQASIGPENYSQHMDNRRFPVYLQGDSTSNLWLPSAVLDHYIGEQAFGHMLIPENRTIYTQQMIDVKPLRFPLSAVLPGNSLNFDHIPYPGLFQASNTLKSDLSSKRNLQEGLLTTHSDASLAPPIQDGISTISPIRITNQESHPLRDYPKPPRNIQGAKPDILKKMQHLNNREGNDGYPAETLSELKTSIRKFDRVNGHVDGQKHHNGLIDVNDHRTIAINMKKDKYKENNDNPERQKGRHDEEHDSIVFEDKYDNEEKHNDNEDFHKSNKREMKKKGGENIIPYGTSKGSIAEEANLTISYLYVAGEKHKKGQANHGDYMLRNDEFIKNTKFSDEDREADEYGEHNEFHNQHEEKRNKKKEGSWKESDYGKMNYGKEKRYGKGHIEDVLYPTRFLKRF